MADVAIEIKLPNGTMLRLTSDEMRSVYETLHQLMGQQKPQHQQPQQMYYQRPDGQTVVVQYPTIGQAIPLPWRGE